MTTYAQGFYDGLLEAARVLRDAADDHRNQSRESKKVLEAQAHELGAALLGSWANGLEINANTAVALLSPPIADEVRHG